MTENTRVMLVAALTVLAVSGGRWLTKKYGRKADLTIRITIGIVFVGTMVGLALFA